jgi:serine/threonine protein phosphatase PrpC
MLTFHHTCIGYSHLASGKPCQDASYAASNDHYAVAIVSDGHGGEAYSRSDVGAQMALHAARYVIDNNPLTSWHDPSIRPALFDELVRTWRDLVTEHDSSTHDDDTDITHVFDLVPPTRSPEITMRYGCTLMLACVHPNGWFAFQIGDGKCVAIHPLAPTGDPAQLTSEPIPNDERCFLNQTTSLCDADAAAEFRFCGGDRDSTPVAIFLGSDGIDDSWGSEEALHNFYIDILKHCASREAVQADLADALPQLSRLGSHDDMSVAAIVDKTLLGAELGNLLQYQLYQCREQLQDQLHLRVGFDAELYAKKTELAALLDVDEHLERDMLYLENRLSQIDAQIRRLTARHKRLISQITALSHI